MSLNYCIIGKHVKAYRHKMDISQMTLSELTHKSPTFISHIENGSKKMSLETFVELCNALGVSADSLLYEHLKCSSPVNNEIAVELKDCSRYEKLIILDTIKSVKASLRTHGYLTKTRNR